MTKTETAKLAEIYRKMTGRPHRTESELKALLNAINEYNRWKTQQTPQKSKTLF